MNKNEYEDFFAEFYDILHRNNKDVDIYINKLKEYGRKVLELGMGTGRIAIPLSNNGYEVTGIEYSEDMINILKNKEFNQEKLTVVQGNALDFKLDNKFNVILATCNFINHFSNTNDLINMFKCAKEHLEEKGVFIIDCSLPNIEEMVKFNGEEEILEFYNEDKNTKIVDKFKATFDFSESKELDEITLEEYEGDNLIRSAAITEELTYYMPRELRTLIGVSGLKIIKESGSLYRDVPIDKDKREMIFYCGL